MISARNTSGGDDLPGPSGVPAYKALYEQLRTSILTGQLAAGARLPPTRHLATETGLSRNTVLAAFEQLRAEGYIAGRQGSGTYVAHVLPEQLLTTGPGTPATTASSASPAARLSARGERLIRARRLPLPSVLGRAPHGTAFLVGLPALDAFPFETWTKLYTTRIRRSGPQLMRYDDAAGYRPLREAIATYISTARGIRCTADQVIVTTGSQQALEFCARILLDPGDPAWLEDPGYLGTRAALTSAGARIVPVPVDENGLDVTAGIHLEPDARLAAITPSHQFPLGHTMSLERRLALIDWASSKDAWIVEDDYDAEFRYVSKPHAALAAIDNRQRVIYVGTFSKVLFPSLRLGYVVAPPDLVDGFVAAHLSTDMHAHLIDQAVVADFIDHGHLARHLRRMRVLHHERQHELVGLTEPIAGSLDMTPSDGGLHLVGRLADDRDDRAVARNAVRRGVHVWPLSTHYLGPDPRSALLLGYAGTTSDDMRRGIDVLADILR
ncbi:PLP-dependent aminotransferase family protein [Pseudonocardia endophytica]|uniref:GntR family transcriptional regulator/MocR family aminotransferase n=1 Tax=Pseudonocardia endophytica TaxID=401976 RepID=A0A4R1HJQ6_PSEEN|nr:PLP-dependent aminotransferase family protein [Pseudonocardia endophytica]TCK22098.1 GntR family transcriptional regulator/MocR family aminotransferase [Pseudonocardia endophytica]